MMFVITYYINLVRKKFTKKYIQTGYLYQQLQLPDAKALSKDKRFMNKY